MSSSLTPKGPGVWMVGLAGCLWIWLLRAVGIIRIGNWHRCWCWCCVGHRRCVGVEFLLHIIFGVSQSVTSLLVGGWMNDWMVGHSSKDRMTDG
jgi:hypothetical protein